MVRAGGAAAGKSAGAAGAASAGAAAARSAGAGEADSAGAVAAKSSGAATQRPGSASPGDAGPPGDCGSLAPQERAAWTALLMLHRTVLNELDTELRREHRLAVSEFDVLVTLFNAPGRQLGMSALARGTMLSPAGTTHLVTRLERDGLVSRSADPADRRKWHAALTDQGDRRLRAARRTYDAVLRRSFLGVTTPAQREAIQQLSQRLLRPGRGTG